MAISRLGAIDFIIPNMSGSRIPHRAAARQHSVPGKLTERTGRMIAGLREGGTPSEQVRMWNGWGNRVVRTNPSAYATLNGLIKASEKGKTVDHVGTYSIFVRDNSKALNKKPRGVAPATKQQIALRYRWETGIRGGQRPYMYPSAQKNLRFLKQQIEMHTYSWIKGLK